MSRRIQFKSLGETSMVYLFSGLKKNLSGRMLRTLVGLFVLCMSECWKDWCWNKMSQWSCTTHQVLNKECDTSDMASMLDSTLPSSMAIPHVNLNYSIVQPSTHRILRLLIPQWLMRDGHIKCQTASISIMHMNNAMLYTYTASARTTDLTMYIRFWSINYVNLTTCHWFSSIHF